MAILLTCECGKKLRVADDKAGKKIRCPGCQAILLVAQAEDVPEELDGGDQAVQEPRPRRQAKDDDAFESRPRKHASRQRYDDDDEEAPARTRGREKSSSRMALWLSLGGGLAALAVTGILLFIFLYGGGGDSDLVGAWVVDKEALKRNDRLLADIPGDITITIKKNGAWIEKISGKTARFNWKVRERSGDTVTLDLSIPGEPGTESVSVRILDRDRLRVRYPVGECELVRAKT
jgi:DNA-directed RNA polymerase subunit RPC12/RpoP